MNQSIHPSRLPEYKLVFFGVVGSKVLRIMLRYELRYDEQKTIRECQVFVWGGVAWRGAAGKGAMLSLQQYPSLVRFPQQQPLLPWHGTVCVYIQLRDGTAKRRVKERNETKLTNKKRLKRFYWTMRILDTIRYCYDAIF